ncbi:hypothetical protein J416_06053 [Gracilibacillus halophilus YIM-C55.5]|uniref:Uncharacterized protein n=1 Tax=Gracilibacillus halophilus YIM-C55.5 TaxID=1308866 RepID=N4WWX1_9BACI|nr:hypothetical protein [Gracilibacillus halophilus]ENH97551.1 hypothetical protein J416_06053 [Gracilibacillus halophilus YIM-C55.5]
MERIINFEHDFSSSKNTPITDEKNESLGFLHVNNRSLTEAIITDVNGVELASSQFHFWKQRWHIKEGDEQTSSIKKKWISIGEKYRYITRQSDFVITSSPYSKEYTIVDVQDVVIANFVKLSPFDTSVTYQIYYEHDTIDWEELVLIVVGIEKYQSHLGNRIFSQPFGADN